MRRLTPSANTFADLSRSRVRAARCNNNNTS